MKKVGVGGVAGLFPQKSSELGTFLCVFSSRVESSLYLCRVMHETTGLQR